MKFISWNVNGLRACMGKGLRHELFHRVGIAGEDNGVVVGHHHVVLAEVAHYAHAAPSVTGHGLRGHQLLNAEVEHLAARGEEKEKGGEEEKLLHGRGWNLFREFRDEKRVRSCLPDGHIAALNS